MLTLMATCTVLKDLMNKNILIKYVLIAQNKMEQLVIMVKN